LPDLSLSLTDVAVVIYLIKWHFMICKSSISSERYLKRILIVCSDKLGMTSTEYSKSLVSSPPVRAVISASSSNPMESLHLPPAADLAPRHRVLSSVTGNQSVEVGGVRGEAQLELQS